MNRYVVDTSAWIEYYNGTTIGRKVQEIVEDPEMEIATNIITVAELAAFFQNKGLLFDEFKKNLISLSSFGEVSFAFCEEAGKLYAEIRKERKKISFADVFVLLTARKLNARLLTKDSDFRGFKEAEILN